VIAKHTVGFRPYRPNENARLRYILSVLIQLVETSPLRYRFGRGDIILYISHNNLGYEVLEE